MAFGFGFLHGEDSSFNDFAGGGQFTFSGSVTGTGMSDFFLGAPSTFFQGLSEHRRQRAGFCEHLFRRQLEDHAASDV